MKSTATRSTDATESSASTSRGRSPAPDATKAKEHLRQSSGRPLDGEIRRHFQGLLGVPLDGVFVHDDEHGRAAARAMVTPALAYRTHVAFARVAPGWRAEAEKRLWAHELTHVAQYLGHQGSDTLHSYSGSAETEASRAAENLVQGRPYVPLAPAGDEVLSYFGEGAVDWVSDSAGDAYDYAADTVDDIADWSVDQLRALIPDDILEFVEDVSAIVQSWIEDGFAAWLEDVLSQVSFVDSIAPFFESIGAYATDFNSFGTTISETAGEALSPLFQPIADALGTWINPALEARISSLESEQQAQEELEREMFEQDAQNIQGVVDAIREGVDDIWNSIAEFLGSIPGAQEAWDWLKGAFNFLVNTAEEIIAWVMDQVSDLWEWISEAIEPIKPALEMIAKILFILSPLGPIYILMEYGPQLWDYITEWFSGFDLGSILSDRIDEFTNNVMPFFKAAVKGAAEGISGAIGVLVPFIDTLLAGAEELRGTPIFEWLEILRVWLNWVADEAAKFAKLTDEQINTMMAAAVAAFEALAEFLSNLIDFFVRFLMVVINPWLLPVAISGVIWLLVPDAFKPPVIDFILNLAILTAMEFPADLFGLGPLGPVIKVAIVEFFKSLKGGGNLGEISEPQRSDAATQRKINATNKIASIAAGGGVMFVAGYFVGLLEGLWTGLTDPFVMVWDLLSFVFAALGKLLEFVHGMGEGLFGGGAEVREDADVRADMTPEQQSALDEVMRDSVAGSDGVAGEGPSEEVIERLQESHEAGDGAGQQFEQSQAEASSTDGVDVEQIMNWIWSIRSRLREGAASLGRTIAEAVFDVLELSDFQLGRSLGNLAGQLLFEILLGILTAGGWTALSVAKPFIKVGAKLAKVLKRSIRPLIQILRRLRGPVSKGLGAIGDVLKKIPGMRRIIDYIEDAMRRMMRYVDEFDAPSTRHRGTDGNVGRPNRHADSDRHGRDGDVDRRRHDDDPNRRHDGDDDPNRRHDDDDPNRRRDDDPDPHDDSPQGRQRRLHAAHRSIRRSMRRGMLETPARVRAEQIALRYRVRAAFQDVGPRYRLHLRINPTLDRYFTKSNLTRLKRHASQQNITLSSIETTLTQLWRAARDEGKASGLGHREAERAAYDHIDSLGTPAPLLRHADVAPGLRQAANPTATGTRFEDSVRAAMGDNVVPNGPGGGGFDVGQVGGGLIDITEAKNSRVRASTERSSTKSAAAVAGGNTFALDSSAAGSPLASHLTNDPESASRFIHHSSSDEFQHPTVTRGGKTRVVENQLSAITRNFATNLADLRTRFVQMRIDGDNADIQSVEDREDAAGREFDEVLVSGQIVVRLALNVKSNQALLDQAAGGDFSHVELQAAMSLLNAAVSKFRRDHNEYHAKVRLVLASVALDDEGVASVGPDLDVVTI